MRPPLRGGGGRGGGGRDSGGRGGFGRGGFGGRGGGGRDGGRGGGRGWVDYGPPDSVVEAGAFAHACEGEAVVKLTNEKIPYFNAPMFLENKTQIGKVEEILGPINNVYFTIKMSEGVVATSYKAGDKFFIDPFKLLPLDRFLPKPKGAPSPGGRGGARGGFRGGRDGGGRGGGRSFGGGRGGRDGGRGGGFVFIGIFNPNKLKSQVFDRKPELGVTLFSFVIALAFFLSEMLIFKTVSIRGAFSPMFVATTSTVWLAAGWSFYTKS
ncbi:putative H/ACA ribonucleoprotein complex subunit 1-like protein 1 [Tetrabaena socialis]|uniref:H/ACA ribonucleoprotein complex subunit n=1 Tax=Tetrabaena socialis TaxID=47790 RepID=A0A2J7ZUQ0_9CHLO|nr:putative H/ACA ribonucleoprotein complex subunit 1-like protein 1 [Tetrabaena socialis]|eukprot:PNH04007.1 putative H/ACA ribonucleoprotein complex subunit 1-like protein 1 [Tetrabaena socialis]